MPNRTRQLLGIQSLMGMKTLSQVADAIRPNYPGWDDFICGNENTWSLDGVELKRYQDNPVDPDPHSPYMVVRVKGKLVNGHNAIWGEAFNGFVENLVTARFAGYDQSWPRWSQRSKRGASPGAPRCVVRVTAPAASPSRFTVYHRHRRLSSAQTIAPHRNVRASHPTGRAEPPVCLRSRSLGGSSFLRCRSHQRAPGRRRHWIASCRR